MLLPIYRRCVLSDHEPDCRKYGLQKMVEVFAKKVLNYDLDIKRTDEFESDAPTFVHASELFRAMKPLDGWDFLTGLTQMQLFSIHILRFILSVDKEYTLD